MFAIKQSVKIIIIFINIKEETNIKFGVFEILISKVSERLAFSLVARSTHVGNI